MDFRNELKEIYRFGEASDIEDCKRQTKWLYDGCTEKKDFINYCLSEFIPYYSKKIDECLEHGFNLHHQAWEDKKLNALYDFINTQKNYLDNFWNDVEEERLFYEEYLNPNKKNEVTQPQVTLKDFCKEGAYDKAINWLENSGCIDENKKWLENNFNKTEAVKILNQFFESGYFKQKLLPQQKVLILSNEFELNIGKRTSENTKGIYISPNENIPLYTV